MIRKKPITQRQLDAGGSDYGVLKQYMIELFPFSELRKVGFFTKEMRGDYYAQAERICHFFGLNSVYEYGAIEVRCHISYVGQRPDDDKDFITEIKSIYE